MLKKEQARTLKIVLTSIFIANIFMSVGCENNDTNDQDLEQSKDALFNEYKVYRLKNIPMTAQAFQSKVTKLTGLMVKGKDLSLFTKKGLDVALEQDETLFAKPFQNAQGVFVSYEPRMNKISIENEEMTIPALDVIPRYEADPNGIGEAKARIIMEGFLQKLNASNLVSKSNYDSKDVRVSYYKTGRGPIGEPEKQTMWIDEYLFTLNRRIDGIKVHGDYIRIGVHRTGEVSSISIAETDISESSKPRVSRNVSNENIVDRFYSEIPWDSEPVILENEVAYIKRETDTEAVVEPVQLIHYVLRTPTKDGRTILSEVLTKGFSLVSPKSASVDYSPGANAEVGISDSK